MLGRNVSGCGRRRGTILQRGNEAEREREKMETEDSEGRTILDWKHCQGKGKGIEESRHKGMDQERKGNRADGSGGSRGKNDIRLEIQPRERERIRRDKT